MLSENIIKHLNAQMNAEFYSSNVYLQMSAWADHKGFPGAAKFLKAHAAEEMEHMQRLFTYLCETGALPQLGTIAAPKTEYSSLKEVFEEVYAHEKEITGKINLLVEETFKEQDYSSFNLLPSNTRKNISLLPFSINSTWRAIPVLVFITLTMTWEKWRQRNNCHPSIKNRRQCWRFFMGNGCI